MNKLSAISTNHNDYIQKRLKLIHIREKKIELFAKQTTYSPVKKTNGFKYFCSSPTVIKDNSRSARIITKSRSQIKTFSETHPKKEKNFGLKNLSTTEKKKGFFIKNIKQSVPNLTLSLFAKKKMKKRVESLSLSRKGTPFETELENDSSDETINEKVIEGISLNKEKPFSRNKSQNLKSNPSYPKYKSCYIDKLNKIYQIQPEKTKTFSKIKKNKDSYPLDEYQNCLLQTATNTFSVDSIKKLDNKFKQIRQQAALNDLEKAKKYIQEIEDEEEDIFYNVNKAANQIENIMNLHFLSPGKTMSLPKIRMKRIIKIPKREKISKIKMISKKNIKTIYKKSNKSITNLNFVNQDNNDFNFEINNEKFLF